MVNDQLVITTHTVFAVTSNKSGELVLSTTNEAQAKIADKKVNGEWYPAWRVYVDEDYDEGSGIDFTIRKVWMCEVGDVFYEVPYCSVGDLDSMAFADEIDDVFTYFKSKELMNRFIMNRLGVDNDKPV